MTARPRSVPSAPVKLAAFAAALAAVFGVAALAGAAIGRDAMASLAPG
jgi:hypothetical protein